MPLICQRSAVGVKHDWPPAVLPFNADDHQNAESRMERSITGHSPIAGQHNAMRSADNNNPNNHPNNISGRENINSFYIGNNLPLTIKTWFAWNKEISSNWQISSCISLSSDELRWVPKVFLVESDMNLSPIHDTDSGSQTKGTRTDWHSHPTLFYSKISVPIIYFTIGTDIRD